MKYLLFFILGSTFEEILIRLQGLKPTGDLNYYIAMFVIGVLVVIFNFAVDKVTNNHE